MWPGWGSNLRPFVDATLPKIFHPAGDVTRVSVVQRKVTVKIGENWWWGCRDNRLCNVSKVNPSGKKTAYSAKHMPEQKTISNSNSISILNSQHPCHLFLAQRKRQHLRISWRKPCIWRLDFCYIIKSCSCFWIDQKVCGFQAFWIDLWRQKVATLWFCPLPLK